MVVYFILIVTGFACLGTATGFLGKYWWVFELTSHFRAQYAWFLMVGTLVLVFQRQYQWAGVVALFSIMNLQIVYSMGSEVHAGGSVFQTGRPEVRVVLSNVNRRNSNFEKFHKYVNVLNPDIMVLLEINQAWIQDLQGRYPGYPHRKVMSHPKYGMALFSKIPFENGNISEMGVNISPILQAKFNINGKDFSLIGAHPPSPTHPGDAYSRNLQLAKLAELASQQPSAVMLIGDLNVTPWSPVFQELKDISGLIDSREGFGYQASWPVMFPPLWIPIDHCLISPNIFIHDRHIGPAIGSDHYPVVVDFSIT